MNKFKNLASKLIKNKLWCSSLTYVITKRESSGPGLPSDIIDDSSFTLNAVIKSVSKSLIDNVLIFNSDMSFVIDSISVTPKKDDYIIISGNKWKIVMITPLGLLNNEPTAYELIIRLA